MDATKLLYLEDGYTYDIYTDGKKIGECVFKGFGIDKNIKSFKEFEDLFNSGVATKIHAEFDNIKFDKDFTNSGMYEDKDFTNSGMYEDKDFTYKAFTHLLNNDKIKFEKHFNDFKIKFYEGKKNENR